MKATLIGSGMMVLVLLSGAAVAQDVYKWVDDNGVLSYGETPRTGSTRCVRIFATVARIELRCRHVWTTSGP